MPLRLAGETQPQGSSRVLSLCEAEETWVFEDIDGAAGAVTAARLLGAGACSISRSAAELAHLMAHDSDSFNRWEAGQRLALDVLLAAIADIRAGRKPQLAKGFHRRLRPRDR